MGALISITPGPNPLARTTRFGFAPQGSQVGTNYRHRIWRYFDLNKPWVEFGFQPVNPSGGAGGGGGPFATVGTVSYPHCGVSIIGAGCSFVPATIDLATQGVTMLVGVTIPSAPSGPSGPTFYLLQEDGVSRIILEDGSGFILLESAP